MPKGVPAPAAVRFAAFVNVDGPTPVHRPDLGPCSEWTGGCNRSGYGQFRPVSGQPPIKAHRFAWILAFGAIPAGLSVLHRCDNPVCVRINHLFLGTHQDNMDDMLAKGRGAAPAALRSRSKLSADDVRLIRTLAENGEPRSSLALRFGIDKSGITRLVNRRTFSDV